MRGATLVVHWVPAYGGHLGAELQWPEETLMGNLSWISTRLRSTDSSDQLLLFCSHSVLPSEQKAKHSVRVPSSTVEDLSLADSLFRAGVCFVQVLENHTVSESTWSSPGHGSDGISPETVRMITCEDERRKYLASSILVDEGKRSWC